MTHTATPPVPPTNGLMTQDDIRAHYEQEWMPPESSPVTAAHLTYSSPVQDAVIFPAYHRLIHDLRLGGLGAHGSMGRILDAGCGSGRWIRFFLKHFAPEEIVAADFAEASGQLLGRWLEGEATASPVRFIHADIAASTLPGALLEAGPFDLVNVANVLFHIPEDEKFANALRHLASLVGDNGAIVTTEYLPRATMRTKWMLVRSRYELETRCAQAGLRIAEVRGSTFFSDEPMGMDGPDAGPRRALGEARAMMQAVLDGARKHRETYQTIVTLCAAMEQAVLTWAEQHVAPTELPAQKLVVLRKG